MLPATAVLQHVFNVYSDLLSSISVLTFRLDRLTDTSSNSYRPSTALERKLNHAILSHRQPESCHSSWPALRRGRERTEGCRGVIGGIKERKREGVMSPKPSRVCRPSTFLPHFSTSLTIDNRCRRQQKRNPKIGSPSDWVQGLAVATVHKEPAR